MSQNGIFNTGTSSTTIGNSLLIGGDFASNPWQRGTSFTSATNVKNLHGKYLADRWMYISDTDSVANISQGTDLEYKATVAIANKKFGMCQILLGQDCTRAVGGFVSVGLRNVKATGITKMRMAVISWTGTYNAPTNPISAWGAAGTNPTLAASWTYENTPVDITITSSYSSYFLTNVAIDTANTKQFAIIVWCDDTAELGIGDIFQIGGAAINIGPSFLGFPVEKFAATLSRCCTFYCQTYDRGTQVKTVTNAGMLQRSKVPQNTTLMDMNFFFPSPMWKSPTIAIYSTSTGATANFFQVDTASDIAATCVWVSNTNCLLELAVANANAYRYLAHVSAEAELGI